MRVALLTVQAQGVVQKDLVYFFDVGGQVVDKLAPVGGLGTNDPKHKLVFRHGLDVAVHPGGHAAVDIGVGTFQYKADAHITPPSVQFQLWMR